MKETGDLVAKKKKILQGKRGFSHILLWECHTWKDYTWPPNPATHHFSQHLYNAFFHHDTCSWSYHHVTPWCLQHSPLPKVGISQVNPCKLRPAYQSSSTPISLEMLHVFLTMPDWHCYNELLKACAILLLLADLTLSYASPLLCQW